jgi:aspartate aminotransferase-like enzyme
MPDPLETNLRIPGPTPIPPAVRDVMSRQMINHRGAEYGDMQAEVLENLRHFFQTESEVLLFSGSGTGGLEAALVNTLSPGDQVLAVTIGVFGERFAQIAAAFGLDVHRLEIPWGHAVQPDELRDALDRFPAVKAVLLTCNETSTGVMNDISALAPIVKQARTPAPLLLVDAVSALGAIELPMDALHVDVVITGSQKAWMAPPGITMLGVSPYAWEAHAEARLPRFYWDFSKQRKSQAKHMDAWTPTMTTMFALHQALRMMRDEGRAAIFARHARVASHTQSRLEQLGLTLFADGAHRSRTVTAAVVPEGVDGKALLRRLRNEHSVVLGGGKDRLEGKIVRIGHMGWVEESHIDEALAALEQVLERRSSDVADPAEPLRTWR